MDERRRCVVQPAQSIERNVAGSADDHQPAQLAGRSMETTRTTVAADPLLDDQVPAADVDLEAVAVGDGDASVRGSGRLLDVGISA
jgi:hypothetical protein